MRPHRQQPTRLPRPWESPGKNTGVGCHFLLQCMKVKSESEVAQSCLTLSDPMDCSLPCSFIHGIFQARVLEWVAIAFSYRGIIMFSHERPDESDDWNQSSHVLGPTHPFTIPACLLVGSHTISLNTPASTQSQLAEWGRWGGAGPPAGPDDLRLCWTPAPGAGGAAGH